MIKITVWDNGGCTFDRYLVRINDDLFTMSEDAHMPNGVNMYAGTVLPGSAYKGRKLPGIPACILTAVFRRATQYLDEKKEAESC